MTNIRAGHLLDDLLAADKDEAPQGSTDKDNAAKSDANTFGWFWRLKKLPDEPQSRYLYALLADNDFQEGLKNWRDLGYLQRTLARWDDSMDAFAAMIDTRERAYAKRLPQADALLASDAPARLSERRNAADSRLNAIETGNDVAALGTPQQREQWTRILQMEEIAAAMAPGAERDESVDKLRLIKGVLYWRLDADFKQRSYEQRHALQELDAQLQELQNRWVRVQLARATVPSDTGEFAERIAALAARIKTVRDRLADSSQQQSQYLSDLAESELQSQRERITTYTVQARVQLADIYDRAADQGDKAGQPKAEPAPSPEPQPQPSQPPTSLPQPTAVLK
jgi:chromosome segregation ATPase